MLKHVFVVCFLLSFISCKSEDPVSELNALVREYGFIGFFAPVSTADPGTLLAGRPSSVAYVAPSQDCFPDDRVQRYVDDSNISRRYSYLFQGNLGFLAGGNPIISGGLGLEDEMYVEIELNGIQIEYMSSIDISEYYIDGMSEVCREYLDNVGFIVQSLLTDNMTMRVYNRRGRQIGLNSDNIGQFFSFDIGVDWEIIDEYTVEVTTPKYIGYQLGQLRKSDAGMVLYRAMQVSKKDQYVFEKIGVFQDADDIEEFADNLVAMN